MSPVHEWVRGGWTISTDPARLDVKGIHDYLRRSYWAAGIGREVIERAIRGSLAYGIYGARQVGFGRVISDQATFAYVADVFVLEEYRQRGLARWLMQCMLETPELQGLRRWLLVTRDAHALYRKAGFTAVANPEGFMEIQRSDVYAREEAP